MRKSVPRTLKLNQKVIQNSEQLMGYEAFKKASKKISENMIFKGAVILLGSTPAAAGASLSRFQPLPENMLTKLSQNR